MGSFLYASITYLVTLVSNDGLWTPVYVWLPVGLLCGFAGYKFYKLQKSPSLPIRRIIAVLPAILGAVFTFIILTLIRFITETEGGEYICLAAMFVVPTILFRYFLGYIGANIGVKKKEPDPNKEVLVTDHMVEEPDLEPDEESDEGPDEGPEYDTVQESGEIPPPY